MWEQQRRVFSERHHYHLRFLKFSPAHSCSQLHLLVAVTSGQRSSQAKRKLQLCSETSCFRSSFLKFFHSAQKLFSSGRCRAVCVVPRIRFSSPSCRFPPGAGVFSHIHTLNHRPLWISTDVRPAKVFANGGLLNKLKQMLFFCLYL